MTDTPNDMKPRKQKKSETLEVRLPYETKQAFLTACREDGTTASEVVRTSIDDYLESGRPATQPETGNVLAMIPKPLRRPRVALGVVGAVGLAVFATLPSAAAPDFKSQFNRFDKNKDGVISLDEFANSKQDGAGKSISTEDGTSVVMSIRRPAGDSGPLPAPTAPTTESKQDAYTFWLPDVDGKGGGADAEYKVVQHNEIRILSDEHAKEVGAAAAAASGEPVIKRSFKMCTKTDADEKPVCTESGEPPTDFKAMAFSLSDMRKSEFKQYDADGDGRVSFGEYQARQTAMLTRGFQMLDQNSDGSLSTDEYARIVNPPMPAAHGAGAIAGAVAFSGVMMQNSKYTPDVLKAAFQKLDKNADGKLSLQEYLPQS